MNGAFKKAHDQKEEVPAKEAGRLTDKPQLILVPPGVSRTAAPPLPALGSPPPQKAAEQQRMARIERMKQNLKTRDDPGREEQRDQSR